ncbi:MAG: hypothetical protein AW09_004339 [Candidatus Accumulibacter phosphatis]|uniref:Uncharacterized protein n=1 Tax=Candidatus Accumulibacter phosphatis TaxID=327160 RepID=A0A080LST4_9PROT|nr:MAG: hypothetical protein AW09_004339 [Candidatus Accumulibacter phosphatis]
MLADGVGRPLANLPARHIDAAHPRLRREMHELCFKRVHVALAQVEALLGEDDDAATLRRFVGERRQLRGVAEFCLVDTVGGQEGRGLAIAERDRAGLVEQ